MKLERLLFGIEAVTRRVARFPLACPIEAEGEGHVLRRLTLTELPYVILYAHPRSDRPRYIWFVRLFHHRQERTVPDLSGWPR